MCLLFPLPALTLSRSIGAGRRLPWMRGTGPMGWAQLEGQGGRLSLQAQAPRWGPGLGPFPLSAEASGCRPG